MTDTAEAKTGERTAGIWRAGDQVLHRPTGEKWVLAYVDGDHLAWCGWPEGEAEVADCDLIMRCTDDDHLAILKQIVDAGGKRARMARSALEAALKTEGR